MPRLFTAIAMMLFLAAGLRPGTALAFDKPNAKSAASAPHPAPLTATARLQPSKIEPGGTAELILDLRLVERYHAYLDKFKLSIESPDDLKLDQFKVAPVVPFKDVVTKTMKDGIEGKATMRALVEVPQGFKDGAFTAKVKLVYQACTDEFCLFPKTVQLEAPFTVFTPAAMAPQASGPSQPLYTGSESDFLRALKQGTLAAVLLMFVAGFLTSLTPCVYPMIPITLAVLGAREKNQSHLKSFSLALVYVLGIAFTYSILGVAAASTGTLFGSALGNVWVVSGLALVSVAMGLSMYGFYEIQAPAFVRNRLGAAGGKGHGYPGAFVTGLFAGVVASPCIGPVLVSVLAYIAQTKDRTLGFVLLFSFAMGMGVLFLALGLSSSLLRKIPRAGGWMDSVKYLFGTVMIGMAFYYIHPIYPMWLFQLLLGLAVVLLAALFGRMKLAYAVPVLAIGLSAMALTAKLPGAGASAEQIAKLAWQPYTEKALEDALKEGKPILIDFTAEWCGACKELEKYTFTDPRVREISGKFALLRFDATEESPALDNLRARYQILGLPTLLFYDGKGKLRTELTVTGFEKADDFLKKMETAGAQDVSVSE